MQMTATEDQTPSANSSLTFFVFSAISVVNTYHIDISESLSSIALASIGLRRSAVTLFDRGVDGVPERIDVVPSAGMRGRAAPSIASWCVDQPAAHGVKPTYRAAVSRYGSSSTNEASPARDGRHPIPGN